MNLEHARRVMRHIEEKRMESIVKAENGNAQDRNAMIESVVIQGDLSKLPGPARAAYYAKVCESIGVNPLTRPFAYIKLKDGTEKLYALRDCADQLRSKHKVTISIVSRDASDDVYVVTARAMMPDGRADESTGAVAIKGLQGEALANALMKAETKAKRRVTLSICGLGWLDETEVETIPQYAQQLPRIHMPHGEPAEGVELLGDADEVITRIEAAETMAELGLAWSGEIEVFERYSAADRKVISQRYHARKRKLEKPGRDLDAAAAAATEDDL